MGQTDSQFKAFIRFVIDALKEINEEKDEEKRAAKMAKVLDNQQKTLEDYPGACGQHPLGPSPNG